VTVPGGASPADGNSASDFAAVTPDFFTTLGIVRQSGSDVERPIAGAPGTPTERSVVINEAFARKFFAGRPALGATFRDFDDGDTASTVDRVAGIVADVKYSNPRQDAKPMYFVQVRDGDWPYLVLVIRTASGDATIGASAARAIAAMAPGITVNGTTSLSTSIDDSLVRERISATLGALFAAIALALVAVGVYGVMLYQVSQRTTEIGIRMALGAQKRGVLALVLNQSLSIVAVGIGVGAPMALFAGRGIASQLYGVSPYSVGALLAASLALVAVAVLASIAPAYRAVSVDPIISLRASD
jgi:putative ABC transport system permease protein